VCSTHHMVVVVLMNLLVAKVQHLSSKGPFIPSVPNPPYYKNLLDSGVSCGIPPIFPFPFPFHFLTAQILHLNHMSSRIFPCLQVPKTVLWPPFSHYYCKSLSRLLCKSLGSGWARPSLHKVSSRGIVFCVSSPALGGTYLSRYQGHIGLH